MNHKFSNKNITLAVGESSITSELKVKRGKVINVVLQTTEKPSSNVYIKIDDEGDNEIHPKVSYLEFLKSGGSHREAKKELSFDGNQTIKIEVTSKTAISGSDFDFDLLFEHE